MYLLDHWYMLVKLSLCKPFLKNSISAIHAQKYFAYLLKYPPRIWLKNALIVYQCGQQIASSSSFWYCPPIVEEVHSLQYE